MAREVIADNEFYTLEIDTSINRSFSYFRGFWPDTDQFKKEYMANAEKVIGKLKPGATNFVDIREFKVPPPSIMELFVKVQELSKRIGVRKSASVTDQPIQSLAADRVSREAEMKETMRNFNTVAEAEAWLNE